MLIYLLFGRIDSVLTTVEIGVASVTPDSFRDCPSATLTCPLLLMLLKLARTSKLKVRHLTHHREETSILLLSPLLYIFEIIMVAALFIIPTSTQP